MIPYLKEVGRGKKGARDLSYEEARQAAMRIASGEATPAQIGAFLMAERLKPESADELLAFVEAFRAVSHKTDCRDSILCSGPFDGRRKTFMAGFASAFVLAACKLPVVLQGSGPLPPKWGITLPELLNGLGIGLYRLSEDQLLDSLKSTGILAVPSENWCPPLFHLRGIREELGVRTLLNTVEKLINWSDSAYVAIGVFHNTVIERLAAIIARLGFRKGLIVQGMEGSEDLAVDRRTRTVIVQNGHTELHVVDPEVLGLDAEIPEVEWTPDLQIRTTKDVLQGKADTAFSNMVLLNSAVKLLVADRVSSLEEGICLAKTTLDRGIALSTFEKWRKSLHLTETAKAE